MKREMVIIAATFFFILFSPGITAAEDFDGIMKVDIPDGAKLLKTDKLAIKDIAHFMEKSLIQATTGPDAELTQIYGIHQDGNSATIFYQIYFPGTKQHKSHSTNFVKLNSGVWFSLEINSYVLTKKRAGFRD